MSIVTMSSQQSKRKAENVEVPRPGEDPAERKRVLNVLAQRRYRQRKKEHFKKLEQLAKEQQNQSGETSENKPPQISPASNSPSTVGVSEFDLTQDTLDPSALDKAQTEQLESAFEMFPPDDILSSESDPSYFLCNPFENWDATTALFPIPTLPSSPSDPYTSSSSNSPVSAMSQQSHVSTRRTDTPLSFPDEAHLPMLELNLLRGAVTIAKRLNVESLIWSLDSISPFNQENSLSVSYDHLPFNLRPTAVQLLHPHHPVLDIMPWPSVRDRLILIFSQPTDVRPPIAASPTALVDFVYDIEDSAEGVRIWGDDPCSDENWEVGQKVFSRWWWAFESAIINKSNAMRSRRGANLLAMESDNSSAGTVLGEIQ